jgi:hypothetical protein
LSGGTVFLLSPASATGRRGALLTSATSRNPLVARLAAGDLSLGEAFAFVSSLYFRGKLAYARHFAAGDGVLVITPTRGLQRPETIVTRDMLLEFAGVDLASADDRFRAPLLADAAALDRRLAPDARVVLLGSIATAKYVAPLSEALHRRLCFPPAFIGRGDMSRGGLLLRSVEAGTELDYVPFSPEIVRRGTRPPKLPKR